MNWYNKVLIKPGSKLLCPSCQVKYPFGAVFDHHKRICPSCKIEVLEWHLDRKIVLIIPALAPVQLTPLISYLKTLSESEVLGLLNLMDELLCQEIN
jgi:hypothetical protein